MRINQGLGPTHNVGPTSSSKAAKTTAFNVSSSTPAKAPAATPDLDGEFLNEVKALAHQMQQGHLSKEEAAQQFAALVMEKRHDLSLFGKKGTLIAKTVQEVVGQDPEFTHKLQLQLSRLNQKV